MKTTLNTLLFAAALILNAHAVAPGPSPALLERQAKAEAAAKAVAVVDAKYAAILGTDWQTVLANSPLTEGEVMANAYVSGKRFVYPWNESSQAAQRILVEYLANKPTLDKDDLGVAINVGPRYVTELAPRHAELLGLLDPKTLEYYRVKYSRLKGASNNESEWMPLVTATEWLTLASGEYTAATYKTIQTQLLLKATKALAAKCKAADQESDGPAFDAALAPVVTALSAPLFEGLADATAGLGLDLVVPDYTATTTKANLLAASMSRRTVSAADANKSLGTVMFVKGVTGYNAWIDTLTKP